MSHRLELMVKMPDTMNAKMKPARYGRGRFTSHMHSGRMTMPMSDLGERGDQGACIEAKDDIAVLLEQARARQEAVDEEAAEEDRGRVGARDAEARGAG